MQNLIDVSAAAVMAALVEQLHKIAQYWRKWYASLLLFVCGKKFSFFCLFIYRRKQTRDGVVCCEIIKIIIKYILPSFLPPQQKYTGASSYVLTHTVVVFLFLF
jgi:hypothetical protein